MYLSAKKYHSDGQWRSQESREEFARLREASGVGASMTKDLPHIYLEVSVGYWRKQNAINLDGVFLSVMHCLPLMRKTGGGSIVMMSSLAGLRGAPGLSAYSATKGGVRLFAKSIAMECAAAGDGIRVNCVSPGASETRVHADAGTPDKLARIAPMLGIEPRFDLPPADQLILAKLRQ